MSSALPSTPAGDCCVVPCDEVVVVNIPGVKGDEADPALDGIDGISAFTLTAANFTMPAEGANVVVSTTSSTDFFALGVMAFVQSAGYMKVMSLAANSVTLRNEENTGTGAYSENVVAGTIISSGVKVCLAGIQGQAGAGAAGQLLAANNLSDVAASATARTNLGLAIGTNVQAFSAALALYSAISPSANVQSALGAANYAALRTLLGLVPGTDVQAFSAALALYTAISPSVNIQSLLGAADYAAARALIGVLPREGLLGSLIGADFNSTADQAIAIASGITKYVIRRIVVTNASVSLTTAAGGVYGAAAKSAPVIVAAAQVYSALTAAAKFKDLSLEAIVGTDILTQATIYLSLTVAQGVAATASVFVFGDNLS